MKEYVSDQSRILWPKVSYIGHQISMTSDVSHCTKLKYFTQVTVTGHQALYEISATVRDFEHYIRDWSLAYSFIYTYIIPEKNSATNDAKEIREMSRNVLFL